MSKTERLLAFIDVIEYKCLTKVAKNRSVTKAAVNKQLSLLENECGIQLIDYSKGKPTPTAAGLELYERTKELKNSLNEIDAIFNDCKLTPQGVLRVYSSISFAKKYIFPRLNNWFEAYPLVRLNLEVGDRVPNIEKENFDIIMGIRLSGPLSTIQVTLGKIRYYLCASPEYINKHGLPKKLEDLRYHCYLSHPARKANSSLQSIKVGKTEMILDPFFYLNNFQGLVQLAVEGVGIVWVSEPAVENELANGNLIELFPDLFKDCYVPVYLYYKETKHVLPKIRAFIEFVKECYAYPQRD